MRKLIIIILGLISVAYGQKYQSMPQAGYGPVKRIQHDSVLTIPLGIERLRNLSDGRDSGQIRYNPSDSSMYVYTGHTWVKCGRSELSALAPLYAYNDTTIAIDTTSSEGVATKWDLSQVGGGGGSNGVDSVKSRGDTLRYFIGGDSTYIANFGVKPDLQGALNNGSTLTQDVTINGAAHNFTIDSVANFAFISKDYNNAGDGSILLQVDDYSGTRHNFLEMNTTSAGFISSSSISSAVVSVRTVSSGAASALINGDSVTIDTDSLRIRTTGYGSGKVLTSDDYGRATWQTTVQHSSGRYTPTITNVTNIDASSCSYLIFQRSDSVVTVFGQITVDPTAAAGALTRLRISLPSGLSSDFTDAGQAAGAGWYFRTSGNSTNQFGVSVAADVTNDQLEINFAAQSTASAVYQFTAHYILQ